jgi:hypothetical protein
MATLNLGLDIAIKSPGLIVLARSSGNLAEALDVRA